MDYMVHIISKELEVDNTLSYLQITVKLYVYIVLLKFVTLQKQC